jgi:hypothetical protein
MQADAAVWSIETCRCAASGTAGPRRAAEKRRSGRALAEQSPGVHLPQLKELAREHQIEGLEQDA